MYYPIIDKLKDVMEEIGQSGGGGQLVIDATSTSDSGGTWAGNFSDIETAFNNHIPVFCIVSSNGQPIMCSLLSYIVPSIGAFCTPISIGGGNSISLVVNSNNTFTLTLEQG